MQYALFADINPRFSLWYFYYRQERCGTELAVKQIIVNICMVSARVVVLSPRALAQVWYQW